MHLMVYPNIGLYALKCATFKICILKPFEVKLVLFFCVPVSISQQICSRVYVVMSGYMPFIYRAL